MSRTTRKGKALPPAHLPLPADKNCPIHRKPCALRKEENYFFALSKYQHQLEASRP